MKPGLLLALALLAGCGYRAGQLAGEDGGRISVPVFRNDTLRRDLERDLTRHVTEEIRSRSGYRLVDGASDPDLVMEGILTGVSEEILSERAGGTIRESSVTMDVQVRVLSAATGEAVLDWTGFSKRVAFAPLKGESLRTAETAVMSEIAAAIVYTLARDW